LREAIDSALRQTYPHIEIVLVDDGSTDNSREITASYGSRVVLVFKKNSGQASAFNAGFTASRGEIVIFLDADDYLFPHAAERIVAAWEPGVAKLHYRLETVDTLGKPFGFEPPRDRLLASGDVLPILLEKGYYSTNVTSGNAYQSGSLGPNAPGAGGRVSHVGRWLSECLAVFLRTRQLRGSSSGSLPHSR
jgi:glycosyltransferase involved in cell wall biosynthesis